MSGYDVVSKGKYTCPQPENIIPAESFIFIREEGKKYLLLKFNNTRQSYLTGLDLEITQLTKKGKQICVKGVKYGEINAKPGGRFVLKHKIEVDENCADVKVKVVAAMYGAYSYSVKDGVKIEYSPAPEEKFNPEPALDKLGWEDREVCVRTARRRISIAVVSCILLALVLILTALHLAFFTRTEDTFLYAGIEYEFTDKNNKLDCDIKVTGFTGKFTDALIPEEVEGHRVAGIAARAFAGNTSIRTLTVEGAIAIQPAAFLNCKNLGEISIEKVTSVGDEAFRGCASLKALSAPALSLIGANAFADCTSLESVALSNSDYAVTLGNGAFANCTSLVAVSIEQEAAYPVSTLFAGCNNLKNLNLRNLSGSKTIVSLFGKASALETLSIQNLDAISDGFCEGLPLKSVKIENLTGTAIGDRAFDGCPLEVLDIPVKPTAVGDYSFRGSKFEAFIENELSSIGDYAFANSSLTEFDATNLLSVGAYAFSASKGLKSVKFNENSPCSYLGEGAFSDCTSLVALTVPAGVRELSASLFRNCASLQGVTFAGSRLTSIGAYAFAQCTRLPELQIPESVTAVGDYAFSGCTSVYDARIPRSVSVMGKGMLNGCSNLSALVLSFGQYSDLFLGGIFGASSPSATSNYIPSSLKTVSVEYASQIPAYAFYGCAGVESILFPETLNSIGEYAFAGCAAFKAFEVPDSVNSIGKGAFENCKNLAEITLPFIGGTRGNYTYLGYIFGAEDYYYTAVPEALKKVTVTSAKTLGKYSFAECRNIETVNLPATLTEIGEEAFSYCTSLEKLVIPASVGRIAFSAFNGCTRLYEIWNLSSVNDLWAPSVIKIYKSLEVGMTKENVGGFEFMFSPSDGKYFLTGYESAEQIILPSYKSYAVAGYAFANDEKIYSVTIPSCVTEIYNGAFENCRRLKLVFNDSSLNITAGSYGNGAVASNALFVAKSGDRDAGYANIGGVQFVYHKNDWAAVWNIDATEVVLDAFTYNGKTVNSFIVDDHAFSGEYGITSVKIGSAVRKIGSYAFSGTAITEIVVPATVTEMGMAVFENCNNLVSAQINAGVTSIGSFTFANCSALTSVTLPRTLESVEEYAFVSCNSLTEITLPASLTRIGDYAFEGCNNLLVVYNFSRLPIAERSASYGGVARRAVAVFKSESDKAEFFTDGDYSFVTLNGKTFLYSYNGAAGGVTLPETEIGYTVKNYAFENYYISYAVIPESVKGIEANAFQNNAFTAYYRGTEKEWKEISTDFPFNGGVYFYTECVHEEGKWTYDGYGNISTQTDAYAFTHEITKPPTCMQTGTEIATCVNCGHKIEITLPPTGVHEYEETVTKQPTCTEDGEKTFKCKHCGESYTVPIEKTGHDYGEDGVCTECGKKRED